MILYSFEKIMEEAGGNVNRMYSLLHALTYKHIPKNKKDPLYSSVEKDFNGNSFVLHPELLFYNAYKYTKKEVVQYFGLASFRPVAQYLANQTVTIPVAMIPLDRILYIDNRLLHIDEHDVLHFLYEEVPEKEIH